MQVPVNIIRSVARQVSRRHSSYSNVTKSTYNDLPTPSGSWQTHYDAQQRKYNAYLAAGVAVLLGTILVGKTTGMFEFYNDYPEKPADIESYKS